MPNDESCNDPLIRKVAKQITGLYGCDIEGCTDNCDECVIRLAEAKSFIELIRPAPA